MFGYVRPFREELKVRELEAYEAMYCGLCHTMGRRNGFAARMFLNYDFTFLAMLLAPQEDRPSTERCRCPANPFKKKCACVQSEGLETAADESVILSYWKLRDTVADSGFWTALGAQILSLLLLRGYRRAAACQPVFDMEVRRCLEELHALEREKSTSLDYTADTFARILKAAAPISENKDRDRVLKELLYHLGRWIYLVDAWDDLEQDRKAGRYNPIHQRFEGEEQGAQDYLRTTMRHSRNLAASAYALERFGAWGDVIENILFLGLPAVEELVFRGEWGRVKKQALRHAR